jgi:hypothetical protein
MKTVGSCSVESWEVFTRTTAAVGANKVLAVSGHLSGIAQSA